MRPWAIPPREPGLSGAVRGGIQAVGQGPVAWVFEKFIQITEQGFLGLGVLIDALIHLILPVFIPGLEMKVFDVSGHTEQPPTLKRTGPRPVK